MFYEFASRPFDDDFCLYTVRRKNPSKNPNLCSQLPSFDPLL